MMDEEKVIYDIIGACRNVNRRLGYGLVERVYQIALCIEIKKLGYEVEEEVYIDFKYGGVVVDKAFRIDLLVNKNIIVEIKALSELPPVSFNQLYTYLKLTNLKYGVLVNFGEYYFNKRGTFKINAENWAQNKQIMF